MRENTKIDQSVQRKKAFCKKSGSSDSMTNAKHLIWDLDFWVIGTLFCKLLIQGISFESKFSILIGKKIWFLFSEKFLLINFWSKNYFFFSFRNPNNIIIHNDSIIALSLCKYPPLFDNKSFFDRALPGKRATFFCFRKNRDLSIDEDLGYWYSSFSDWEINSNSGLLSVFRSP